MLRAFITCALAAVLLGGISDTAMAAPLEAAGDRLEVVSVLPGQVEPGTPGPIRFKAALDYQLESAQRGYLLLFYFENEATNSGAEQQREVSGQRRPRPARYGDRLYSAAGRPHGAPGNRPLHRGPASADLGRDHAGAAGYMVCPFGLRVGDEGA